MIFSKNIRIIIASAIAVLAMSSCKKDESGDEVLPSLGGQLRFEIPSFIEKGGEITVTPSGIIHPEGKEFGYYCTVSSVTEKNDTLQTGESFKSYTLPDSLGTYTVTCTAFASGYYSTSTARYVTTVDAETSLIDRTLGYTGEFKTVTDGRDGKTYNTVVIGDREWFAENLAYIGTEEKPLGIPYDNAEAMTDIFGRYYTWTEAASACPDGWRLPDADDWLALANELDGDPENDSFDDPEGDFKGITGAMMVDAKFNAEDNLMWEYWPDVKITNASGLCMIPCGYANTTTSNDGKVTGIFDTVYLFATFWTGTENPDNTEQAYIRYIYWDTPVLQLSTAPKASFATPIRCVRDSE